MGNGKAVSIYVGVLSGRTPSSASMSDLFDAYKLADYLLDETAENAIMNAIVDLCSTRGKMDRIDVDYVLEYRSRLVSMSESWVKMLKFVAATGLPCSSTKSKIAQFIARSQSTVDRHDRQ